MPTELTLETLVGTLTECGCCPPPGCCPPQVECQSGLTRLSVTGFVKPSESSDSVTDELEWRRPHYRIFTTRRTGVSEEPTSSNYPSGGETYTSRTMVATWVDDFIQEYPEIFRTNTSPEYFRICALQESLMTYRCVTSGGWTVTEYTPYFADGSWHNFKRYEDVATVQSVAGDQTEEHLAWEAIYTDAATWQGLHDTWATDNAAYGVWYAVKTTRDDWEAVKAAHDAWLADPVGDEPPQEGVEPPQEGTEPPNPDEPDGEPAKFYPPCTLKTTNVRTTWERNGSGVVVLTDNGSAGDPNPHTTHSIPGGLQGSPPYEDWEFSYSGEITYDAFLAAADAWHAAHANFDSASGSDDACVPGNGCVASKVLGQSVDWSAAYKWFRYRFKHNKCCAWQDIRSEWDQVLYHREWLLWRALMDARGESESTDPPLEPVPPPVKTPKVWTWTGTPPRCLEPSSSDDSSVGPVDPFDYEPMWSPWSAVVKMPAGEIEGLIINRNYQQKCYEAPPQEMPQVFGVYEDESAASS